MKFNWSTILVIAMAVFIVLIVGMGIRMASSSSELYEQDYYAKGEDHAIRMEQEKVGSQLTITYDYKVKGLLVQHKNKSLNVEEVVLRKMANSKEDFKIRPTSSDTILLTLSSGAWVAEIQGTVDGLPFFKKMSINK